MEVSCSSQLPKILDFGTVLTWNNYGLWNVRYIDVDFLMNSLLLNNLNNFWFGKYKTSVDLIGNQ